MLTIERNISFDELEEKIRLAKEAGKRILALSPSTLKRESLRSKDWEVTHYILVTM